MVAVSSPTVPLAGESCASCWKVITDCFVEAPKFPSSTVWIPSAVSQV